MHIRTATPADAPVIARFNAAMARETEGRALAEDRLRRGVEAVLKDPNRGRYFVATIEGEIVGQLLITYEWSDWRDGNFWWLQSVYVERAFRRQGVFAALFRHVQALAQAQGDVCGLRLYVDAHNTRARAVYEKLGLRRARYELFELDFVLSASGRRGRGRAHGVRPRRSRGRRDRL